MNWSDVELKWIEENSKLIESGDPDKLLKSLKSSHLLFGGPVERRKLAIGLANILDWPTVLEEYLPTGSSEPYYRLLIDVNGNKLLLMKRQSVDSIMEDLTSKLPEKYIIPLIARAKRVKG